MENSSRKLHPKGIRVAQNTVFIRIRYCKRRIDRELDREPPRSRAAAAASLWSSCQWGPVIFNAWPVRPVFPEDRNRDGQHSIPVTQRRCTLEKIRASAPPRKRVIPRDRRRPTEEEGGRAYKDIPDRALLHRRLFTVSFCSIVFHLG